MAYELKVNGRIYGGLERPTRTLLRVLRGELGLVGTKQACGIGICGACTILLDGRPVSSCTLFAGQAAGKEVVTVEGLGTESELHRVQEVFVAEAAFQCAYCTPGFVLSTVALLSEAPHPTDQEIREYLAGNLCRCGSYKNILAAVRRLAAS